MADVGQGKVNVNLNVEEVTRSRIDEMKAKTRLGKGAVVDIAIARLYKAVQAGEFVLLAREEVSDIDQE